MLISGIPSHNGDFGNVFGGGKKAASLAEGNIRLSVSMHACQIDWLMGNESLQDIRPVN